MLLKGVCLEILRTGTDMEKQIWAGLPEKVQSLLGMCVSGRGP